jgi:mRNA interferase HicA
MKRVDLIRKLEEMGCILIRHGGRHDWYQNPTTKAAQTVSRHREIKDSKAYPKDASWQQGLYETNKRMSFDILYDVLYDAISLCSYSHQRRYMADDWPGEMRWLNDWLKKEA